MPILGYQSKFYEDKLKSSISKKSFGFDKFPIFSLKNHSTLLGSTSMNLIARDRVMRFCIPLFCAKQDVKVSQYLLIFAKIFDVNFENCVSEYSAKGHCMSEYSVKGSKNLLSLSAETLSYYKHCFKWLKFHFCELEHSHIFAGILVPIGWIIFSGLWRFFNVYLLDLICTVYLYLFSSAYFCAMKISHK